MPSALEAAIGFQALIIIILLIRSIRVYYGRPLQPVRLFLFPALTILIFLLTEAETIASIPSAYPLWAVVDAVTLVAAAAVTIPLAPRFVTVTKVSENEFTYRYGIELIALYLGLWVVRFALALVYDPNSLIFSTNVTTTLTGGASSVMLIVQTLFAISSGIVVGRSIGAYRLYLRELHPPPLPSPPSALP